MHFPRTHSTDAAPAPAVLRVPARRLFAALASAALLLGGSWSCGGSEPAGPTTPPGGPVLEKAAGDDQAAAPGATLPVAPRVRLLNDGVPRAGAVVRFQVTAGGGSVVGGVDTTDAQGFAEVGAWTIGSLIGGNSLEARLDGTASTVAFTARGAAQVATAAPVSVGTGGGTVQPVLVGSGIDTLTITVPAGAYGGTTTFHVSSLPVPAAGEVVGGGIVARLRIDAGGAATDSIVRVHVPLKTRPGQVVAAYWYDSTARRLDPVQVIAADANGITIGAGRFSWGTTDGITPSLRASLQSGEGTQVSSILGRFRELVLTVVEETTLLERNATTSFLPGRDDWDFVNLGTYITPAGNCHGQTLSALWYHDVRRSTGAEPLSKYHTLAPAITQLTGRDNRDAYLHATMVQRDANQSLKTYAILRTMLATESDRLNFLMLVDAIRRTGKPQLLGIAESASIVFGVKGGHAVVAYGVEIDAIQGRILIADPNHPGRTDRFIVFDRLTGRYEPYQGASRGDESATPYRVVRFIPRSLVPTWADVGARWSEFLSAPSSVASGLLPAYDLRGETRDWIASVGAGDTLPTTWEDSVLLDTRFAPELNQDFDVTGWRRDSTVAGGWELGRPMSFKSKVKLDTGENRLTVYVRSKVLTDGTPAARFIDVRRIRIKRRPLALTNTAGGLLPPADTVKFDAGRTRRFALRFDTGDKLHLPAYHQVSIGNVTGATGVSGTVVAFPDAQGVARDSFGITFSTSDTNVKRIRFDLLYNGKVVRTVIAQVVRPQVILTVSPSVITGARTSSGTSTLRSNLLVCTVPYSVEIRGSDRRELVGEMYRMVTDSGQVHEDHPTYDPPAGPYGPGRYTGTGSWDWRVDQAPSDPQYWMGFRVEWKLLYRNVGETEQQESNTVTFRCQ